MKLERSPRFIRAYTRLTPDERRQVDAHLRMLAENPRHPSLRARRWPGSDFWYFRVSTDLRILYDVYEDYYLLLDVGLHNVERVW